MNFKEYKIVYGKFYRKFFYYFYKANTFILKFLFFCIKL